MKKTKVSGFTLTELVTVMTIVAVLAAILMPTCMGYIEYAHNAADLTNIHHMINAVNEAFIFDEDKGFYDNCWGYEHNEANKDMGYIYVDSDEVRTSNKAIARMLE
ncbi:MAG: type II secretion system GspH family protein [Oscillospiraceae bacterium]|nr:type II secretion system GspH family protein [Oscillospiraceae bacterium]